MGLGSWARFIVGIILSAEIIHQLVLGKEISSLATTLAIVFFALTALFFIQKIFFKM